ncbi:hypothetical protein AHAS_Ahas15G0136400 [Arachis hypogaea]
MRSTQRSENMHSVFDKYLNSKSSLLQFFRQYQNCVIDKEQKELECDAADLRGIIPCVSSSPIEKQFQREYTNSMFRDIPSRVLPQSSEVQCDCFMFQSNSILCCHSLVVLLHFCVTAVSSQYILSRWSKNVSWRHTYIRSSIDMDRSDESMTIFRELCSDFYVDQDFVATSEVAAICVMPWTVLGVRPRIFEKSFYDQVSNHIVIYSLNFRNYFIKDN